MFVRILLIVLLALTTGCPRRSLSEIDPSPSGEQRKEVDFDVNRDLDILFVIDDSNSMREEQNSLIENFDRFIGVLEGIEGGLPNVHIGVVSTNLGAGGHDISGCEGDGDRGELIGTGTACTGPQDRYIVDVANADGSRERNYSGDLAATFSCLANLGIAGCGFEQQLEAMRRALDENPVNAGFLRDDAYLAVIFITDEDDCSAHDPTLFDSSDDSADSELGEFTSFRCFDFGVECEPDEPRATGTKQRCEPRADSPYLHDVQGYIEFLRGLKDDPQDVMVAGIVGLPSPVSVSVGTINQETGRQGLVLDPSCTSAAGEAAPAVRLAAFLDGFPERNTLTTICNDDLTDALVLIASLVKSVLPDPCLDGELADVDGVTPGLQPDCTVSDIQNLRQADEVDTVLPPCELSPTLPCWQLHADAECSEYPTGLALRVCRGLDDDPACPAGEAVEPPDDTTTVLRCLSE